MLFGSAEAELVKTASDVISGPQWIVSSSVKIIIDCFMLKLKCARCKTMNRNYDALHQFFPRLETDVHESNVVPLEGLFTPHHYPWVGEVMLSLYVQSGVGF